MKRYVLLMASMLAMISVYSQGLYSRQNWSIEEPPLRGNVAKITIATYEALVYGGVVYKSKSWGTTYYTFNGRGDVVESLEYEGNLELKRKCTYKYDASGRVVEENEYDGQGRHLYRYAYQYNSYGVRVSGDCFDIVNSSVDKIRYKHDSRGNIIEEAVYGRYGGDPIGLVTRKYDSRNRLIKESVEEPGSAAKEFKYASNDLLSQVSGYDDFSSWVSFYDSKGCKYLQNITYVNGAKVQYKYTYKFDSVGNVVECITYESGSSTPSCITEYVIVYR